MVFGNVCQDCVRSLVICGFSFDGHESPLWQLTPELSRPTAGRRQRASVAQSTLLTPRCGVGLNDLLGGKEASEDETLANLPKTEAELPKRAPDELSAGPVRSDSIWSDRLTASQSACPKPVNSTHVMSGRAPHTWTKKQRTGNLSEEQRQPKPINHSCEQHNYRTLFCRLTFKLRGSPLLGCPSRMQG